MSKKEPKFMQDIHKVREKLGRDWKAMTTKEFLESLHDSGRWLRTQISLSRSKKMHQ